jgi:hypothetical protein
MMTGTMALAMEAILVGAGATFFLDLWSAARARFSAAPAPDYALVGRWLAYLPRGRFVHHPISASQPVRDERLIGWTAHYLIGMGFAAILVGVYGQDWMRHPALLPALLVGVGSVSAPFLVMQPGMGLGFAASRTANPAKARRRSLVSHGVFGVGLYGAGWLAHLVWL